MSSKKIRRNIHTYPFKYKFLDPTNFFRPDNAAIYVHIPFCNKKCHFCDYVVYTNTKEDQREAYVQALCKEIQAFKNNRAFPGFYIDSIYFGGGTPGLLKAEQLIRILDTIRQEFPLTETCEIGLEFDPGCVEKEKAQQLYEAGFRRLSMGVQSFSPTVIEENNRPHNLEDVFKAWKYVQEAGFTYTNLDLIYPLLGLDMETWVSSVQQAIDMKPACITLYPLEVWPKTAYYNWLVKNKKQLPEGEVEVAMCRTGLDMMEANGFTRMSTSGYYHPERSPEYCRFLDYYWRTWPMIGFGVGSKSVIYDRLYTNISPLNEYIQRINAGESVMDFATHLDKRAEMRRIMIRGLKMNNVSKPAFFDRFGVTMESQFGEEIETLVNQGFLINDPDQIYLTREGQVFASNCYEKFYTEDDLREPTTDEVQFGISTLMTA